MNMLNFLMAALFLIAGGSFKADDAIKVYNMTPRELYVALYYLSSGQSERIGPVQLLESKQEAQLSRPTRKLWYDRQLAFSEDEELLKEQLSGRELEKLHAKNVGTLQGRTFYIGDYQGEFYGYNSLEWEYTKPIIDAAYKKVFGYLHAITANPYKNKIAKVRVGNELAPQEKEFLQKRMPKVQQNLEEFLQTSLTDKYIPKIALVCSGGGYRAMLFSTGAMLGASEAGLFDSLSYLVSLSGSTWAIGTMMSLGFYPATLPDYLISRVPKGLTDIKGTDAGLLADSLLVKYIYGEPISIVDIYGGLLANTLFEKRSFAKQEVHLSEQSLRIKNGELPLPIYTAVRGESLEVENQWYEFTPYEIGAHWLGMYVPSWAFGRKFKNGVSINYAPEQSFGFLLATFGLAIGITIERLFDETKLDDQITNPIVSSILSHIKSEYNTYRAVWARVFNFTAGMKESPLRDQRTLKLIDAGISFNLPYPPISGQRNERKADIIIFIDASGGTVGNELRKTEHYARQKGLKFPRIDYQKLDDHPVTVFADPDPTVPVVIYLSRLKDAALLERASGDPQLEAYRQLIVGFDVEKCILQEACSTFNFNYTVQEAKNLIALAAFNIKAEMEKIKKAIVDVIERKSKKVPEYTTEEPIEIIG